MYMVNFWAIYYIYTLRMYGHLTQPTALYQLYHFTMFIYPLLGKIKSLNMRIVFVHITWQYDQYEQQIEEQK